MSPLLLKRTHVNVCIAAREWQPPPVSGCESQDDFGDLALPYGLNQAGRMVAIHDVQSGLACECVCPKCKNRLVAKKGAVVRHHFAHHSTHECVGSFESMAHMLAKQIIADERKLFLPAVVARADEVTRQVRPSSWVEFDAVSQEVWMDGIRPDLVGTIGDRSLAIEIFVAHRCESEKIATLRERKIPTVEVDLQTWRAARSDMSGFRASVLHGSDRWWLFHQLQDAETEKLVEEARQRAIEQAERDRIAEIVRQQEAETEKRAREEHRARALEERRAWEAECAEKERQWHAARKIRDADSLAVFRFEITQEAFALLGQEDAQLWLDRSIGGQPGVNHLEGMPSCPELYREYLHNALWEKGKKAADYEVNKDKLLSAARAHFRDPDRAILWFRSINPKLGRKSPMQVCRDKIGMDACLAVLK